MKPILERSCVACHQRKSGKPAGNLVSTPTPNSSTCRTTASSPARTIRLALDEQAKFGHKPVIHNGTWRQTNASRYVRMFQSRRSLLVWKIYGERLDGWTNDDFPTGTRARRRRTRWSSRASRSQTRKPTATAATSTSPAAQCRRRTRSPAGKVQPLTDEDRRTLVRWIDLGCPIDLDYDPEHPDERGFGWMCDDKRPTLTLAEPVRGAKKLQRIRLGAFDYYSGLEVDSLEVIADFPIDDAPAGENLAKRFKETSPGSWLWEFARPIDVRETSTLKLRVKDKQGNQTEIVRTFSVEK